jgi:hypothetical protein
MDSSIDIVFSSEHCFQKTLLKKDRGSPMLLYDTNAGLCQGYNKVESNYFKLS